MIRLSQLKIEIDKMNPVTMEKEKEALIPYISKYLHVNQDRILSITLRKRSLDARKKENIQYIYTIDIELSEEEKFWKNLNEKPHKKQNKRNQLNIQKAEIHHYNFKQTGIQKLNNRPVVIGFGPAGMFCALELARAGFNPLVLERGEAVEERIKTVEHFWKTNELNSLSNVQFGEGGAGTFSDGKLNTLIKDPVGRNHKVLEELVRFGADGHILYQNKPHIGTDCLREIVKNIREEIIRLGGEIKFHSLVTDFVIEENKIKAIEVNHKQLIPCDIAILAIGHSARDTFKKLYERKIYMESKAFAIGVRVEHPQEMIGLSQYGKEYVNLPAAEYKVTHQTRSKRGVYSFCMCPGGFVVNSSSEQGHLVVNGMSNSKRDEKNANSAIIVSITPDDFSSNHPLSGVEFQRKWERLAYEIGGGFIPTQVYGDFKENKKSLGYGAILPNTKGAVSFANLRECLPDYVCEGIIEGIEAFDKKIKGFSNPETILCGVETRTSSPVRITRNYSFLCNVNGIYPCGEGAGYAGGITSAAMDGIKIYEAIASVYKGK